MRPLEIVHTDIAGPFAIASLGEKQVLPNIY